MRPRILIADNSPEVLTTFQDMLSTILNCEVFTASSPQEAFEVLRRFRIHVALVDIRLDYDENEFDDSGINVLSCIDDSVGKVVITAFESAPAFIRLANLRIADAIYFKTTPLDKLIESIQMVLARKVHLTCAPKIRNPDTGMWTRIVERTEHIGELVNPSAEVTPEELGEEVEELLTRLICSSDVKEVEFIQPSYGRSGSGTIFVQQWDAFGPKRPMVVKFDSREKKYIAQEELNYRCFVVDRLSFIPVSWAMPIKTKRLEAITYAFQGNDEAPRSIPDLYSAYSSMDDIQEICDKLAFLFRETSEIWRKKMTPQSTSSTVAALYIAQWDLASPKKQNRIRNTVENVLTYPQIKYVLDLSLDDDTLKIANFGHKYPNPITLAFRSPHLNWLKAGILTVTHGDMNARNIILGPHPIVWLIDFFHTGYGHQFRDFVKLESSVKFELLETDRIRDLYEMELILMRQTRLDEPLEIPEETRPAIRKALDVIATIRAHAARLIESPHSLAEYYVGLLFNALQLLSWREVSLEKDILTNRIHQCHALLAAAIACAKLQDFDKASEGPVVPPSNTPEITSESAAPLGAQNRKVRILFLAANPKETPKLRLDEEIRTIDERLRSADFRERFELVSAWAVRYSDLSEYLLRYSPDIVHFSGHGSSSGAIVLEDKRGSEHQVSASILKELFSILRENVRCVVLNACWSVQQADALADEIDCVVGMGRSIGDRAAIEFASGFYRALGYGRSVEQAFKLGCLEINLANIPQSDVPQLRSRKGCDPAQAYFGESA